MQSSEYQQGEIRKPFSVINAKKQREVKEWEIGKTRDSFKKIRDTKRKFHAKMGSIKDINDMDLTKADNIKKRWQDQGYQWNISCRDELNKGKKLYVPNRSKRY